jgi:hypothetical protein
MNTQFQFVGFIIAKFTDTATKPRRGRESTSIRCHSPLNFGGDHTHEEMTMRARDEIAPPKLLMYLSPTNRRGVARLEAPSNRSIADAPARVIYAADIERREDRTSRKSVLRTGRRPE